MQSEAHFNARSGLRQGLPAPPPIPPSPMSGVLAITHTEPMQSKRSTFAGHAAAVQVSGAK